ncbi:FkbM family methyltransferase [Laribacter hongkongensis]|uniref:FkbM family methyltransferase n=1 Tax=Laribacter hongkongensis TaxID=168471 RepID=UPI001EFDF3B9|nr:FkbM family methyltransferase [Laribacter hongkongensis]MCG9098030.1 FkbM family methyltransferase [Laribacter hongkongensis]
MHKFYGQFTPSVDQFIFERYFRDTNIKGVFVECGAFDGLTECSCKFFEESMSWKGYNIEPVPWVYKRLCDNRAASININCALSNRSGSATFQAVDHPTFGKECTNGSLAHTDAHKSLLQEGGCSFIPVEVSLMSWRDFVQQYKLARVDLLVLDVEGHEFSVIEGMRGCEVLPDLICIEVGHLDFEEIRNQLNMLGYVYDISSHVNAFFVKAEKIPLFALRAAASSAPVPEFGNQSRLVEKMVEENQHLTKRVEELAWLYREVTSSKLWKVVEKIRSWRL